MSRIESDEIQYALLTEKQRQTLELLIKHKTSKQISRELGISPHTVDQRIESAKRKFGVNSRGELAQAFRRLQLLYERMTYEEIHIAESEPPPETSDLDEPERLSTSLDPNRAKQPVQDHVTRGYRVGPEMFNGKLGTIFRIAAILTMAALLVVVLLGAISIFAEMSQILSK
ncbi:MAG: helix-turn-helix transcriptional regulator [Novosphingobium sp.]